MDKVICYNELLDGTKFPIIRTGKLEGFVTTKDKDPFYTRRRFLKPKSPLKTYIETLCPEYTKDRDTYTLIEILGIIKSEIEENEMFDKRNPFVAVLDDDLSEALQIEHILTSNIQFAVTRQLLLTPEEYANTMGDDSIVEPHPKAEKQTLFAPSWASMNSTAYKAQMALSIDRRGQYYEYKPAMRKALLDMGCIKPTDMICNFATAVHTVAQALVKLGAATDKFGRPKLISPNSTGHELFGVCALDMQQIQGFVTMHITKTSIDTMPNQVKINATPHDTTIAEIQSIMLRHIKKKIEERAKAGYTATIYTVNGEKLTPEQLAARMTDDIAGMSPDEIREDVRRLEAGEPTKTFRRVLQLIPSTKQDTSDEPRDTLLDRIKDKVLKNIIRMKERHRKRGYNLYIRHTDGQNLSPDQAAESVNTVLAGMTMEEIREELKKVDTGNLTKVTSHIKMYSVPDTKMNRTSSRHGRRK